MLCYMLSYGATQLRQTLLCDSFILYSVVTRDKLSLALCTCTVISFSVNISRSTVQTRISTNVRFSNCVQLSSKQKIICFRMHTMHYYNAKH